ncbi:MULTISPECIES: transglycosylase family protein [unclassified Streptomyces]|uniref:transglycosylase family protein n=1 Tax=unclassified Streptomyces TaxID=2593676 RepID=UPI00225AA6C2|nr:MULTISPECIES: transglycosylase family protein [unclassified Streptomyces]MCX4526467.1 transglycosylase family protein [Streptomyces sp. NBC_01551]MCX4542970.1 transglycosylase family protein [Streptomyces sp. NBC_01565]
MRSVAARKNSVLAVTATALLAVAAPLLTSTGASAASVSTWDKVAQCEASGNWSINTGNGYYGGLQISMSTWRAFGGTQYAAYPHQATKQQQILTGEKILAGQGQGAWPSCGPAAGLGADHANPYPSAPSYPDPSTLPAGTLVKSPNGPDVKVMISGAGVPVAASDVTPDKYDLSKIVLVDNAAFNGLPTSPPAGTVVHDQAGGAGRYVVIDGAALPISAADWTADGYNTRPDMGVPTAWLKGAVQRSVTNGRVLMDQSGTDPSRYVMLNGAAVFISASEWTANGYDKRSLMGVPSDWLASTVGKQVANGSIVKDVSGADATVYVMAGGVAVPLTYADFTAFGYDKRPLEGAPGTWLKSAAAQAAPVDGTMLLSPDSNTVWQVTGGKKKAMTADQFGAGKLSFDDVVSVPTAFTTKIPTAS